MNHTKIVADMNDTVDFCEKCSANSEYHVYRPLNALIGYRNHSLHKVMHYTDYTPEY